MKTAWSLVLLLAALSCGCLELPKPWRAAKKSDEPKLQSTALKKAETPRPAAPRVTAAQLTEANAHAMADALDEEIARDEQALLQPAEAPTPVRKKK